MAMKSLTEIRNIYGSPALSHKWTIEIPTWPSAVAPANPNVVFMITTSSVPDEQHTPVTVDLGGFPMGFRGKSTRNGNITWTFFENTDNDIIKYFFVDYPNAVQEHRSVNSITMVSKADKDLIIPIVNMNFLGHDARTVLKQYQLVNCYFTPTSSGANLGQDAAVQQPTVDVSFDSFVISKS